MSLGVRAPRPGSLGWRQEPLGNVVADRPYRYIRRRRQLAQCQSLRTRHRWIRRISTKHVLSIPKGGLLDFAVRSMPSLVAHGGIITVIRNAVNTRPLLDSDGVRPGWNQEARAGNGAV